MPEFLIEIPAVTIKVTMAGDVPAPDPVPDADHPVVVDGINVVEGQLQDFVPDPAVPGVAGRVKDLKVTDAGPTWLRVNFHGVMDDQGNPANHELRVHKQGEHWGLPAVYSRELRAVPAGIPFYKLTVPGEGANGFTPGTDYVVRVIAFRGKLGEPAGSPDKAVFGVLSAAAPGRTLEI